MNASGEKRWKEEASLLVRRCTCLFANIFAFHSIAAVKVAKEQELEMWRRRASYDPMKAALEGKKKQQEESRRQLAAQQQQQQQSQLHSERQSKSSERFATLLLSSHQTHKHTTVSVLLLSFSVRLIFPHFKKPL